MFGTSTLSALRAFGVKMEVTAHNVANASTDGFKKDRALLSEGNKGHVQVHVEKIDTPGHLVYETRDGVMSEKELSNVDLAEELPRTIPDQRGYEANLAVLRTRDEMLGTLVDIIG